MYGRAPRHDRDARAIDALFEELKPLAGQNARFEALAAHTERLVRAAVNDEFLGRPMIEAVARVLHGAEMLRHGGQEAADVP